MASGDETTPPTQLDTSSYTYHRLQHATPEHLHLTSRRAFIGPIPEGWLRSHRKDWYKHHLGLNYSSKSASFTASKNTSRQKRLTGLGDGPSASALYRPSFARPDDLEEVEDAVEESDADQATTRAPPAINVPRSGAGEDEELTTTQRTRTGEVSGDESVVDDSTPLDGTASPREPSDITNQSSEGLLKPPAPSKPGSRATPSARPELNGSPKHSDSFRRRAENEAEASDSLRISSVSSRNETVTSQKTSGDNASTTSLLRHDAKPLDDDTEAGPASASGSQHRGILSKVKTAVRGDDGDNVAETEQDDLLFPDRKRSRIHFDLPDHVSNAAMLTKARMQSVDLKRPIKSALRRRTGMDGQIMKMEKMLVRIDTTLDKKLPSDYDENSSQGVVTRTQEKWREFMVVVRQARDEQVESGEGEFVLQIWKTRVIPAIEKKKGKKATRELPLDRKRTKVNLYSSLDKSVVIWVPNEHGTSIIILRPSTTQSGVEWFTFLRNILGSHRSTQIVVNVPDMSVSLRVDNPFASLEEETDDEDEETAAEKAAEKERRVAQEIIDRCLAQLKNMPEWADVVDTWASTNRIGLAWKRYDRLEWIYGVNERKMYGTIALARHMELELRAKEHYPTHSKTRKGKDLTEPPAVEGFLVRLTSQKGVHQRMGKLFFKRLYFHTHDQFLIYSRPAKADPPPPPRMPATTNANVPSSQQISEQIPLIYAVSPFPTEDGQIKWLKPGQTGTPETRRHHDQDALDEYKRNVSNVDESDGYINLCDVRKLRNVKRDAKEEDVDVDSGSDVEFDEDAPDNWEEDGSTDNIDDARTFELVLNNGLVIRLQAFDKETKKEWKKRLRALVKYWRYRHSGDVDLLKQVRKQNLQELQIDEETEAQMGQFAKKWEVTKSFASPTLYNMCGISCCRTLHMSGLLYFKPRLHKLFTAMNCLLIPGNLLLYETISRKRSGAAQSSTSHELVDKIALEDCYLYSGLLTENDLLYQNRTFDSNNPGHNALPRMWLDDQWTSRDEDVMCCFVLWRPLTKGWFKSLKDGEEKGTRLKRVTKLGATGRSTVFRARSRAERDRWVLALAAEIERGRGAEDVRIVET